VVTGSKGLRDFDFQAAADKPPVWDELRVWIGLHGYAWGLFRGTKAERIGVRRLQNSSSHISEAERFARISSESFWTHRTAKVQILCAQLTAAIFPTEMAKTDEVSGLFALTHPLNPTDRTLVKPLSDSSLSIVFAPSSAWTDRIEKMELQSMEWLHPLELAFAKLGSRSGQAPGMCLYTQEGAVDLVVVMNGKPVLANRFEAETPQEALYYALRAGQSVEWNPAEDELFLMGSSATEPEWLAVFQEYVRHVRRQEFESELEANRSLFDFETGASR
jgi:hypothetical protein